MPRATLKVRSNAGLVALTDAYPEVPFTVLGAWPSGEDLRLLVETAGVGSASLEGTLEEVGAISDYEIRRASSDAIRFEVETPAPEPHGAMAESGVVPSFPVHVEGGWLIGDLVASREQLSAFRDELLEAEIEHEIVQVSRGDDPPALLTDRQAEVIELAVERGYYDSPRGCSVTDLAGDLDVDKSVVSRVLHRAEGRIVTAYWSSDDRRGPGERDGTSKFKRPR